MSEQELSGPDFERGIPETALADGAMLGGHSGGESVVLVRRGNDYFAIGGTCTHYSGPLSEGILTGDFVRCPWHHACFDLRTGAAVRTPALGPVPIWKVERRDGLIFIREKGSAPQVAVAGGPPSVTILGAGAAGVAVADTLRREGYAGKITLISRERDLPYDRPNLSKDYLAGKAPEEWMPLHSREYYDEQRVDLALGTDVTRIDAAGRSLQFADGRSAPFDVLVIATGAEPRRLDVTGGNRPHVHYLRSFADSRAIIQRAADAKHAVIIGASFIGLEVAGSLRARNIDVTVVGPEQKPLERILGPELGAFIRNVHEQSGVAFRLGHSVRTIDDASVTLDSGERLPADLVVIGIGVIPNATLAQNAGIQVDNGIVVDAFLQTSIPGIYAAGDLARWPDSRSKERIRVEHWVVAGRQGQTVARNILGRRETFDTVPFFWSAHGDVVIRYVGHATDWDSIEVDGDLDGRDAKIVYRKGGKAMAVATISRDRVSLEAEAAFERGESL